MIFSLAGVDVDPQFGQTAPARFIRKFPLLESISRTLLPEVNLTLIASETHALRREKGFSNEFDIGVKS